MTAPALKTAKDPNIEQALRKIDWDFKDARSKRSIHSFHSYPAKFIPEIPRSLIRVLPPSPGSVVFDPFCGCGTTLVEAQAAGYSSVGVDLNPIACLLSRVKTKPLPNNFLSVAQQCLTEARRKGTIHIPDIPNLAHWFKKEVSEGLAALRISILEVADPFLRDALEATFSSIIVRVSNQDSDTRYAAVDKRVSRDLVFSAFDNAARTLESSATTLPGLLQPTVRVIERSIFEVEPADIAEPVGLVITSPPYPNAYEYWLYHKYRMWWLNFDPLRVKSQEIGARAHFFSGRREKEDFRSQMTKVFTLLASIMCKGGHCCFIVGDSKIHGQIIDNSQLLLQAAADTSFELVFRSERVINQTRKSFNLHHARIKCEHVLVWKRT
jgi:hypothetical protein